MTPPWVARTSRICELWRQGDHSITEHFQGANPDLSDELAFVEVIGVYLGAHPELCELWQDYVNDKRSTPSPLLDLRHGRSTAWVTSRGQRFCPRSFNSAEKACSNFLWMEANWVLRRTRTWMASVPTTELAGLYTLGAFDAALERFRIAHGLEHKDGINVVALVVAQQFLDGVLSFSEGDQILNFLWSRITNDLVEHRTDSALPELASEIYDAFDIGEYDHGDDKDPVTIYTVPTLRHVVSRFGA